MKKEFEHDKSLTELLESVDEKGCFRKHDAGYHHDKSNDVILEYSFERIGVYIPYMWKRTHAPVQKEILQLALMRSQGSDVPMYGPRALAHFELMGRNIDADRFVKAQRNIDELIKCDSYSDWTKSRLSGRYIVGCYDPDLDRIKDVRIWGRNIHYAISNKKE